MFVLRSRFGAIVVALAMVASAAVAGALIGEVTGAEAVVTSGDRPVMIGMDPTRMLDTRPAPNGPIGVPTAGKLLAQQTMHLGIAGTHGIPSDATSVQLNVTTVNASDESFLTLFAKGSPRPLASTMNPDAGLTSFNGAVIPIGADGSISIYNHVGSVDVIIDATGYFVDHTHDDRYYTKTAGDSRYLIDPGLQIVAAGQISVPGSVVDSSGPVSGATRVGKGDYRIDFDGNIMARPNDPRLIVQVSSVTADLSECHWFYIGDSRDSIGVRCHVDGARTNSHFNFTVSRLDG